MRVLKSKVFEMKSELEDFVNSNNYTIVSITYAVYTWTLFYYEEDTSNEW